MNEKKTIRLSPTSGLNLFAECPRCFWLQFHEGIHRPRGPFPSLPSGMDLVIKNYFDLYRGKRPPELAGKVRGVLMPDADLMNKWRNWRSGLKYMDDKLDAVLFGALDDCLVDGQKYIPLDFKTRGSAPKAGDSEKYYQTQLDTYSLLLESNGFPSENFAYLVYYYPAKVQKGGLVKFNIEPIKISTDAKRAGRIFEAAVRLLRGPLPKRHSKCEYCSWGSQLIEFE